jgi:PAS domain S-box-containing protein
VSDRLYSLKARTYFSLKNPDPDFAKELCYTNLTRTWVALYGFLVIGVFFFVLRLSLYSVYKALPGYKALTILNVLIMAGSLVFILLFKRQIPRSSEGLTRCHTVLQHASILYFILIMSVSSGVEYLGTGSLSRLFFAIVVICIFITINWYVILLYILIAIASTVTTVYLFNGDVVSLGINNMHAPVVLIVNWLVSRVFYFSEAKDYYVRKELEVANLSLKEEIRGRLKAMEDLENSEHYLKVLFENVPDAYMIYDAEDRVFLEINSYSEELFFVTREEVCGKGYRDLDLLTPEQAVLADFIVEETMGKSFAGPYEFEMTRKDGKEIVIEMRSSLAMFKGRTILFGIARDITWRRMAETELKKANIDLEHKIRERTARISETRERLEQEISDHRKTETVLRKTEAQSRVLIEKMNDGFAVFDQGMTFNYANERLCRMVGLRWEWLVGRSFFDIVAEECVDGLRSHLENQGPGYRSPYEAVLLRHDGTRIDAIVSPAVLYGEGGRIENLFAVITDITRIRTMEAALRENEEMTRTLLDASRDSVVMLKPDGTILLVNEMMAKNLLSAADKLRGKDIFKLLRPENIAEGRRRIQRAAQNKEPDIYEDTFFGHHFVLYIHPIRDNGETIERIAVFARDITDLKKAEKHIHSLSQELIKVQENERQRISRDLHDNVAQELASLKIGCDMLFEEAHVYPPELVRKVETISKGIHHTIMDVRNLAYDLRPPGLDQLGLIRTINNYCDDFASRNAISVDFFSAGMSGLYLNPDTEINLYRIVQEALHNIQKHSGADRVVVRIIASYPTIILRIEDNGKGFDKKVRLERSFAEKRMGVRSMEERASLLQGKIDIRSQVGKGTKIMVEIPLWCNTRNTIEEGDEDNERKCI